MANPPTHGAEYGSVSTPDGKVIGGVIIYHGVPGEDGPVEISLPTNDLVGHYHHIGELLLQLGETTEVDNLPTESLITAIADHPACPTVSIFLSGETLDGIHLWRVQAKWLDGENTQTVDVGKTSLRSALFSAVGEFMKRVHS